VNDQIKLFQIINFFRNIEISIKEGLELIEKDIQEKGYLGFDSM
jgi:hypothetical protein